MNRTFRNIIITAIILGIGFGIGAWIFGGSDNNVESNEYEMIQAENADLVEKVNFLTSELRIKDEIVVKEEPVVIKKIEEEVTSLYYSAKPAEWKWDLTSNYSNEVFRNLTKVSYMDGLNATFVKAPQEANGGILEITLDIDGDSQFTTPMHTWNITVGYSDCKIDEVLDRDSFPTKRVVDLSELNCTRGVVSMMEELKAGARVAVYHAMDNGISYDGHIDFYK